MCKYLPFYDPISANHGCERATDPDCIKLVPAAEPIVMAAGIAPVDIIPTEKFVTEALDIALCPVAHRLNDGAGDTPVNPVVAAVEPRALMTLTAALDV